MNNDNRWTAGPYRIVYNNYPTYTWSLNKDSWVYENESMMQAIEYSLAAMETFPDAEKILKKIPKKAKKQLTGIK